MFFAEKVFRGPRRSVGRLPTLDFAICAFSFRPAAPLLISGSVGPALRTLALHHMHRHDFPGGHANQKEACCPAAALDRLCSHTVVVTHHAMQCTLPKAPHFTFSPSHPLISHQSSVISLSPFHPHPLRPLPLTFWPGVHARCRGPRRLLAPTSLILIHPNALARSLRWIVHAFLGRR